MFILEIVYQFQWLGRLRLSRATTIRSCTVAHTSHHSCTHVPALARDAPVTRPSVPHAPCRASGGLRIIQAHHEACAIPDPCGAILEGPHLEKNGLFTALHGLSMQSSLEPSHWGDDQYLCTYMYIHSLYIYIQYIIYTSIYKMFLC